MTMTVNRKSLMKANYKGILGCPCLYRVNESEPIGYMRWDYKCTLKESHITGDKVPLGRELGSN